MTAKRFTLPDLDGLYTEARADLAEGAVTPGYAADRDAVVAMLNDALATELVCALRYRSHHFLATGLHAGAIAGELREHADEELAHADRLAARIVQLGGYPNWEPGTLPARSHARFDAATDIAAMLRSDLTAERVAIDAYRAMLRFLGDDDPTTRNLLEDLLAAEEQHAADLVALLAGLSTEAHPQPAT